MINEDLVVMQLDLVSDMSGQAPKQIQFGCESACLRACVHLKEVTVFSVAVRQTLQIWDSKIVKM